MAATSFSSPHILTEKSGIIIIKPARKVMAVKHSQIPVKKAPTLLVRSFSEDKVFENLSEGIICYRDDNTGEIICEGYDEGPRFHQLLPTTSHQSRDAEIINLLQQRLLQIAHGCELNNAESGVLAVQEDYN